jgi:hypothetical protein
LALGRTVEELSMAMTMREFHEWQIFTQSHPLPADIIDLHGAMNLAMLANINRDPHKQAAYDPRDFLVVRDRTEAEEVKPVAKAKPQKGGGMTIAQRMRAMISGG